MTRCVFEERGLRCYLFECADCRWHSHSADHAWSTRAGEVHGGILAPGHVVTERVSPHVCLHEDCAQFMPAGAADCGNHEAWMT